MHTSGTRMITTTIVLLWACGCTGHNPAELLTHEEVNEQDMLTPAYYTADAGGSFRDEIHHFLNRAQLERYHHPLEDEGGHRPGFTVPALGEFGAGKGPGGTSQHHPAVDLHVGDRETYVHLYAAHGGRITAVRDAPKYRHYLAVSKEVVDGNGQLLGKLVTLYAHIDLDLDEADALVMDGQEVSPGDLISTHLYAGTVGGPHLHFEIRYYRPGDAGDETFYGSADPFSDEALTEPSTGPWSYGLWNANVGYGFGHPSSHGLIF
jgi:murein DD-endopeptidase MepM/ murein hydrolase activator NlpD